MVTHVTRQGLFLAREYGRQHKAPRAAEQARGYAGNQDFQPVQRATASGLVTAVARFTGLRRVGPTPRVPLRSTRGFMLPPGFAG